MAHTTENFETKKVIHGAETYPLRAPNVLRSEANFAVNPELQSDSSMNTNEVVEYRHKNARCVFEAGRGLFVDSDNVVLLSYSAGDIAQFEKATKTKILSGRTFWLGRPDSVGFYYHWVLDEVPRIKYLQDAGYELDDIDHFLVRSVDKPFHFEALAGTGVDQSKIVVIEDNEALIIDELIYIECGNGIGLKMNRRVPEYLNSLYPITEGDRASDDIRLYVSRPNDVRRHVEGEEEYLPYLREAGFTVMPMEGLSVLEQVNLFRRAEVVISPHGGALTNLVYCRPGTSVLEIFGRHVFPFYYGLSELCELYYSAVFEDDLDLEYLISFHAARAKQATKHETENLSIKIDPQMVKLFVETLSLSDIAA